MSADEIPSPIADRVRALALEVDEYARHAGRDPKSIRICGVSKRHARELVIEAINAGLTDIGESYVQEASEKLLGLSGTTKHYIGHLQTNKIKAIVACFDVVQSLDRPEAATALARASTHLGRRISALIQINVSRSDRFGCAVDSAPRLADFARSLDIHIDGVMAIGPNTTDRDEIRRSFEEAARLFSQIGGSTLSIGMSADWREAVTCGSTMIRIGSAIFGSREPAPTTT